MISLEALRCGAVCSAAVLNTLRLQFDRFDLTLTV